MASKDQEVQNTVKNIITNFLCKTPAKSEAGSFNAAVHVLECGPDGKECFKTIACAREVNLPSVEVETTVIEGALNECDLFSEDIIFEEVTRSQTARLGEFTQSMYFTHETLEYMQRLALKKDPVGIVIEITNKERSQFSFRAFLTSFEATVTARSDSGLSMVDATFRPTGSYLLTKNIPLKICS